jgi:hypothetical protein
MENLTTLKREYISGSYRRFARAPSGANGRRHDAAGMTPRLFALPAVLMPSTATRSSL